VTFTTDAATHSIGDAHNEGAALFAIPQGHESVGSLARL